MACVTILCKAEWAKAERRTQMTFIKRLSAERSEGGSWRGNGGWGGGGGRVCSSLSTDRKLKEFFYDFGGGGGGWDLCAMTNNKR